MENFENWNINNVVDHMFKYSSISGKIKKEFLDGLEKLKPELPLSIDTVFKGDEAYDFAGNDSLKHHLESSCFQIVTESFFENYVYLTEKTFKPIAAGQPFILVAHNNTLEKLKHLGYKTFHPFILEEYDKIENPYERMSCIVEEVDRLCKIPLSDWEIILEEMEPILDWNIKRLHGGQWMSYYQTNLHKMDIFINE